VIVMGFGFGLVVDEVGSGAGETGSGVVDGGSAEASCSRPHRGHVQVVASGLAWNRAPQFLHATNAHAFPHEVHVYPADPASTCWAVPQLGQRTDGMAGL
jgi:hypothetical protein